VLSGLEIVTTIGMTGALCVWISVGLSLGGFGLTLRSMESRIGRMTLDRYYGMYEHTPTLAGLFLLTGLASIGFPGTIGFVGMELLVEGAVDVYPMVGLAVVVASALNSIAILRAYFSIFTGRQFQTSVQLRSRPSERIAVLVLTVLVLGGGIWPQPGVTSRYHAATSLMSHREHYAQEFLPAEAEPEKEVETESEETSDDDDEVRASVEFSNRQRMVQATTRRDRDTDAHFNIRDLQTVTSGREPPGEFR